MKTITKTTALFFAALLLSINVIAVGLEFEKENYINDIPNNIEVVINQITYDHAVAIDFSLEEEEYIDDIPVTIEKQTIVAQEFSFEEEEYIDDIPASIK